MSYTKPIITKTQKVLHKKGIQKIVRPISRANIGGTNIIQLSVLDGYHGVLYKFERSATRLVGKAMESYLAKRPHLDANHPKNKAHKLLYSLPAWKEWSTYMPGALALEPIHHPRQKRLPSGRRIDPLTARIFRHGLDPVGVRTRTLAAGWIVHTYLGNKPVKNLKWVSLAGGTAAPTMLMVRAAQIPTNELYYVNIDRDKLAVEIASQVTALEGLASSQTNLLVGDIFDKGMVHNAVAPKTADVIDLMGIFEYLDEAQSIDLLKIAYGLLKTGGIIIACNMRLDHPQLNLHRRGVGWPDVIQKSTDHLIEITQKAGINKENLSIFQPEDGIYNIFSIYKQ